MDEENGYKRSERKKISESDIEQYKLETKQVSNQRELTLDPNLFIYKEFDLNNAYYELDTLQNRLLNKYLRRDPSFREAFYSNFTPDFVQFLVDKVRLNEPFHISTMGTIRGGKSYAMITILCFVNALYGRRTTIDYISGNAIEFLMKIQGMPSSYLLNSIFLNDEDKQAMFGYGSTASKMKLSDVQNIIAMNNISTITINPKRFSNEDAFYGLRAFGRCRRTKTVRFMLYNLQESASTHTPMGMVYIPIFPEVVPYWKELESEYLMKKKTWIEEEQRGEGDILIKIQKAEADRFMKDGNYRGLTKKKDRIQYITLKLGSEWTTKQIEGIENITGLIRQGAVDIDEREKEPEEEEITEEEEINQEEVEE